MKRTILMMLAVAFAMLMVSCSPEVAEEMTNPVVGTWISLNESLILRADMTCVYMAATVGSGTYEGTWSGGHGTMSVTYHKGSSDLWLMHDTAYTVDKNGTRLVWRDLYTSQYHTLYKVE